MKRVFVKFVSMSVALAIMVTCLNFSVFADAENSVVTTGSNSDFSLSVGTQSEYIEYAEYLNKNKADSYKGEGVIVPGANFTSVGDSGAVSSAEYKGKQNVLLWEAGKGAISWTVNIPEDALYNFAITYLPLKSGVNIKYKLTIDSEVPFNGAEAIEFTRDWIDATEEPRTDAKGNEIAPEQIETGKYIYRTATDKTGVTVDPYCFYLTAGSHVITLEGTGHPVAIADIGFVSPEITKSYAEVSKDYKVTENKDVEPIIIHAEKTSVKNSSALIPKSNNGSAGMYPVDHYLTKINNIGGTSWQTPGEQISWTFEVKTAGYYQLGARYKQSDVVGAESWRWLKVDGKTPFTEAKGLRFKYDVSWKYFEMGDGENPYYVWLDEGTHTMSLEATLGDMAEFYDRMNKVVTALGDMYLQIVMITGETVDTNRDYELFNQIPTFTSVLESSYAELGSIVEDLKAATGERGSQYIAAMNNMRRVINQMLEAKYIAHIYVADYYSNYTTLSSWLSEMKKMPVTLDEMQWVYAGQDFDWNQPNFLQSTWFEIKRLVSSFVNDYTLYDEESEGPTLKMWVNWGRDQTMALNSLIQDSFTVETGINVNLQIVSASLINGLLAGNFPDVMLHLPRTDPVNYGMRGALLDLTRFDDYEEVLTRFQKGADTPYWHNGALYAIPDTQGFFMMFYRTDVFEQLGLEVPTTWDEFLYCATILQRYNMNVYVPYTQITSTSTVNAGIGSLHLYPTFMMQNGLSIYNDELNATTIDNVEAIQVFDEWTEMYTDYEYMKEADFYNRLRNGSMPLGIANYSQYMTIYSAAPEIDGRWDIANVPGFEDGNSKIAGSGTGAGIVKRSANPDAAWEFLKWWTSADTQARYSNNVESILGMLGRVQTANIEGLKKLSWEPDDLNKILEQWEKVEEVPEVPGSYYLTRAIDQAFWSVINDDINPKDAINKWSIVADSEIERKIKEYS